MKRRAIKLRADAQYHALQAARTRDSQADWPLRYHQRAGIEGTLSQGVRGFGLRRSRYVGLAKTHLQHVFIAAAMNLSRIVILVAKLKEKKGLRLPHGLDLA